MMRKVIYILVLITNLALAQNNAKKQFDEANELYRTEKYTEAIQKYESIVTKDKVVSSELYFNLGNCYYKTGKIAPSIYNYEKALLLNPDDQAILTNLHFAQKTAIDDIKVVPEVGFSNFVYKTISVFNYNVWAWISVSLAFLFLLFFIGYYFSSRTFLKRIFFLGMFVLIALVIGSVTFAFLERRFEKTIRPAIVFAEVVNVKSEPRTTAENTFTLHEGTKVYVKETVDNWKRIQLTDKTEGWIKKEAIKEVKE